MLYVKICKLTAKFKHMNKIYSVLSLLLCLLASTVSTAQPITLYNQFHGNYDFTMIGNTLNPIANGAVSTCSILTQSSANLNLQNNQTVVAAYLYWSGSGSVAQADLDVKLNGVDVVATRTFTNTMGTGIPLPFFGAFADVTTIVQNTGNGTYLFSDMDLSNVIAPYCSTGLNFGGWAIVIVYEDVNLPNNHILVYDGFDRVDGNNQNIYIQLTGLNVIDTQNSKIGFLTWEGDENISVTEEVRINNNLLSNPPLNPANNVFNCTNSFTGANNLWNMDLDFYMIGNYINVGDTSMNVHFRTGQDGVIAQNFVVNLSSELPDATIVIDDVLLTCDSRQITLEYTVYNTNSTLELPADTPIAFYVNNQLHANGSTQNIIPVNGSESGSVTFTVSNLLPDSFTIKAVVDDDGTGQGEVTEINENNNTDEVETSIQYSIELNQPDDIISCDEDNTGFVIFDLTTATNGLLVNPTNNVNYSYHLSAQDASNNTNAIANAQILAYSVPHETTRRIWIRVVNTDGEIECPSVVSFNLIAQRLPLAEYIEVISVCKNKSEMYADLTQAEIILAETYNYVDRLVFEYYPTLNDANFQTNQIFNANFYPLTNVPSKIYVRVTGKDNLWCENIIEIEVNDCTVPKGISPNADGKNDFFDLYAFRVLDLKIYNRHGKLVYEHGFGYVNQWYGQDMNGNKLPDGTYFYSFVTFKETYTGYIQVSHTNN